jgi:hypothetical protein
VLGAVLEVVGIQVAEVAPVDTVVIPEGVEEEEEQVLRVIHPLVVPVAVVK